MYENAYGFHHLRVLHDGILEFKSAQICCLHFGGASGICGETTGYEISKLAYILALVRSINKLDSDQRVAN